MWSGCLPKLSLLGFRIKGDTFTVPISATMLELRMLELSLIVKLPWVVPPLVGLKVRSYSQVPPGATLPAQVVVPTAKSPFVEVPRICIGESCLRLRGLDSTTLPVVLRVLKAMLIGRTTRPAGTEPVGAGVGVSVGCGVATVVGTPVLVDVGTEVLVALAEGLALELEVDVAVGVPAPAGCGISTPKPDAPLTGGIIRAVTAVQVAVFGSKSSPASAVPPLL